MDLNGHSLALGPVKYLGNPLGYIADIIGGLYIVITFSSRADEIKFTRLRLGHTRLTHEFIFKNTPPPICNECRVPFTIEHILLVCPRYYQERLNNFGNQILTLEILLNRKNFQYTRNVLQFLKDSNLYTDI